MYIITIHQNSEAKCVNADIPASSGIFDLVNVVNLIKAGFNITVDLINSDKWADVYHGKFVTCEEDGSPTFPEIDIWLQSKGCVDPAANFIEKE